MFAHPPSPRPALASLLAPLVLALLATACSDGDSPTQPPLNVGVFRLKACIGSPVSPNGEDYRVWLKDPALVRQAEGLIGVVGPRQKIFLGDVRQGSGGINQPWNWHLDPDSISLVDLAAEVCDACPSYVESDVDGWIRSVGSLCTWGAVVVARES